MPWRFWSTSDDTEGKNAVTDTAILPNALQPADTKELPSSSPSTTTTPVPRFPRSSWTSPNLPNDLSYYLSPAFVFPCTIIVSSIFVGRSLYKTYLRRIPGAAKISDGWFHKRSIFGQVTSVGDGDGLRLYHTPGGRLAGWGWLFGRSKVPKGKELKDQTISIRLAGVDAPEAAHFGRPAQPGSQEAMDWLTKYVLHRRVRAYVYKRDQYERAVASVYIWKWFLRRDVGLQMLRKGLATVYEAKSGAEFGKLEEKYRQAEAKAKKSKLGIWKTAGRETPREYKARYAEKV